VVLVMLLLEVAISPFSNGRERIDATGMGILVWLLLKMAISLSSDG